MKKITLSSIFLIYSIFLTNFASSLENKILFKVDNKIITSLDIFDELKYLETINENFKKTEKKLAFEIAKKSLIREKIKEIELIKRLKEIKLDEQYLDNILLDSFKKLRFKSVSDFESHFNLIGIEPSLIKNKITIEILWNQLIFSKYNQSVKIDKKKIIKSIQNNNNKQKQFLLSEILFNVDENEQLDNKYNIIKNKINESNFTEAALIYSNSDTANKGGELGWIKESVVSDKIKNILQNIDVGNHSKPIMIPGGFLILKINDIREVKKEVNKEEEIEKIIKKKTNEQLNQFSNIYFNKIRKDININEL